MVSKSGSGHSHSHAHTKCYSSIFLTTTIVTLSLEIGVETAWTVPRGDTPDQNHERFYLDMGSN